MLFVGSSWPDVDIALDIDRCNFAVKVDFEDGRPVAWAEIPEATNSDG